MKTIKKILIIVSMFAIFITGCSSANDTYNISGAITDNNNQGIEDVVLHVGDSTTVSTDKEGRWSQLQLKDENIITPVKEGYTFIPAQQKITSQTDNIKFEAIANDYFTDGSNTYAIKLGAREAISVNASENKAIYKLTVNIGELVIEERLREVLQVLDLEEFEIARVNNPYPGQIERIIRQLENFDTERLVDPAIEDIMVILEEQLTALAEDNIELMDDKIEMLRKITSKIEILDLFK